MSRLAKIVIALCMFLGLTSTQAQNKTLKNGLLKYTMNLVKDDSSTGQYTVNTDVALYIKDSKLRTDVVINAMGVSLNLENIVDTENEKGLMTMDVMGQKFAAKVTPDDFDSYLKNAQNKYKLKTESVKVTNKTKEILGYTCKKAIVTTTDGRKIDVYFTNELGVFATGVASRVGYIKGIEGLALEYDLDFGSQGILNVKVVDIDLKKEITEEYFDFSIPEGSTVLSYEDLKNQISSF